MRSFLRFPCKDLHILLLSLALVAGLGVDAFSVSTRNGFPNELGHPFRSSRSRNNLSRRDLFFNKNLEAVKQSGSGRKLAPEVYASLSRGELQLPYETTISLPPRSIKGSENVNESTLTLRLMESNDIPAITTLCLKEYGSGPNDFPGLENPADVGDWMDQQSLRQLIEVTMSMKISSGDTSDHAIVVASLSTPVGEDIVGMIEVSKQPIIPSRNPPPIPIPLFLKRIYCQFSRKPLQAWVANLLVGPEMRGVGLGKALVGAVEGIARTKWECESIHLHCDADGVSGKIPQRLYLSLGYKPDTTNAADGKTGDLSWMMNGGAVNYASSVYFVEGVPLLYLSKKL